MNDYPSKEKVYSLLFSSEDNQTLGLVLLEGLPQIANDMRTDFLDVFQFIVEVLGDEDKGLIRELRSTVSLANLLPEVLVKSD